MKPIRILSSVSAIALLGISAFSLNNLKANNAVAGRVKNSPAVRSAADYGFSESAIQPDKFSVDIQQSTSTSTSHSFSMKFSAALTGVATTLGDFDGLLKNVYIVSDDPECPSDQSMSDLVRYDFDPAKPDLSVVEKDSNGKAIINEDGTYNFVPDKNGVTHDYKFKIPTYEGYVYRIEAGDGQETAIIPNYITRQDRYRIHVTGIGKNVFNYKSDSNGNESDFLKGLKNVIIGDNVKTFSDDAFIGTSSKISNLNISICGDEAGRTYGTNWLGGANVNYNYDLTTSGLSESDVAALEKVYSNDVLRNANGDIYYYDNNGYRVDEDGNYLTKSGKIDTTKEPITYAPKTEVGATILSYVSTQEFSSDSTIVFGDYANNRPMILEYSVSKKDGSSETRYYEFPENRALAGIGKKAGRSSCNVYADFHIGEGEKVDASSVVVRNLFEQKDGFTDLTPDDEVEYKANPTSSFKKEFNFSDFVSYRYKSVRQFGEYTSFTVNVDKVAGIYEEVNPVSWAAYKSKVENGTMKIRYSFVSFNSSSYVVTFVNKAGELVTKEVLFKESSEKGLTLDFHLLESDKGNSLTFLLKNKLIDKDFTAKSVRRLEFKSVSFKLDLMSTKRGATQIVTKSGVITRFGYFDILPEVSSTPKIFNADTCVIVASAAYLSIYLLVTFGYYFFAKNKYKNDEFRRMNSKKYFKRAGVDLIGLGIIFYALLFIVLRFGFFNVAVIVYDPLDPFVILFGVAAIISIGIYAKRLVTEFKVMKERRKAMKLKLNEDVAEDGTK
ncbi:MAG: hypothetical protein MJ248_02045 [Bacilli bacterium]|nr:hypothetical protein [Bacilli bacterium]